MFRNKLICFRPNTFNCSNPLTQRVKLSTKLIDNMKIDYSYFVSINDNKIITSYENGNNTILLSVCERVKKFLERCNLWYICFCSTFFEKVERKRCNWCER